ncbi:acyl-coenzyme A thioesterase 2, chloroplastic [Elaeis guineensis]|uniref:acyl-coenzyme A thioesterase 2, chloroplastic n=1 Tax=Elaeis guineensis var. tenera TaxID=51953 RepID=UPI003C6D0AD5
MKPPPLKSSSSLASISLTPTRPLPSPNSHLQTLPPEPGRTFSSPNPTILPPSTASESLLLPPKPLSFSPLTPENSHQTPPKPRLLSILIPKTGSSSSCPQNTPRRPPEFIPRSNLFALKPPHSSSKIRPFSSFRQELLQNPPEFIKRSNLVAPKPPHLPTRIRPFSSFSRDQHQKPPEFIQRSNFLASKSPNFSPGTRRLSFIGQKPSEESPPDSMAPGSSPIRVVSTFASPFDSSPPHINASSSIRKPLSLWPGMYHSPVTNALWEARSSIFERLLDPSKDGPPQTELLTRTPSQSRTSIIYNFSSDYILREQYRDPWNEVRIGKLLEDLDALAGTIAVKHCSDDDSTTRPLLLVTASVDKMVLKKPLRVDTDLKIEGAVTWVGRSSIEIQIEVTQSQQDNSIPSESIALTANFTFVARDSKTGKSAPVNRLTPETESEKLLYKEAEARDKWRKRKREEQRRETENGGHRFHGEKLKILLAEGRVFCDLPALADRDSILMRDTSLENSLICQPQQRNLHGRIFGGFLMNLAFELAFSTAYAFVGQMPCFLEVDHVDFLKPVDVGDFLRLKSCVLYTQLENPQEPLINIEVVAHVTRPELRTSEVSNTFYFTFTVNPNALKNGLRIRNVVPATEEEARRVLERIDAETMFS